MKKKIKFVFCFTFLASGDFMWLLADYQQTQETQWLQSFLFLFILKPDEQKDPCAAMKLTALFKQTHETETRTTLDLTPKANSLICL